MILSPQERKAFEKALATVTTVAQKLAFLKELSAASPELAARLEPIISQHEYLQTLAQLALELDAATDGPEA